jgi:MFS family permease
LDEAFTAVCGMISDRSGRRKAFVIGSAALVALAAVILAAAPTLLLTQILPAAADRARTWA